MLTLLPMLMFVSLPILGRFPPILGLLITLLLLLLILPKLLLPLILPKPGKLAFPPGLFPPITGRSILPGNVDGRLPLMFGRVATPGSVVGRLPSMFGRVAAPGSVVGRLPLMFGRVAAPGSVVGRSPLMFGRVATPGSVVGRLTLPSEGRSPLPEREGRFSPIPTDGRVDGNCIPGGLTCGRLFELGNDGRVVAEGFDGSFVCPDRFGRLPKPPNDGREPPAEGRPPEFPPILGGDGLLGGAGRALTFPSDGFDRLGLDIFGALGRDILVIFGREPPIFPIFGRAPPPPTCPIDGLAPPPPPFPRCANALLDDHTVPITKAATTATIARLLWIADMKMFLIIWLGYLPAAGGSLTTVISKSSSKALPMIRFVPVMT